MSRGGRSIPSAFNVSRQHALLCSPSTSAHTLDRLDVVCEGLVVQVLRSEPVRQHKLASRLQHRVGISEEQVLVREMAQRFAYPDNVKAALLACEVVGHLLGVELEEPDPASPQLDVRLSILRCTQVLMLIQGTWRTCLELLGLGLGQPVCDLNLLC